MWCLLGWCVAADCRVRGFRTELGAPLQPIPGSFGANILFATILKPHTRHSAFASGTLQFDECVVFHFGERGVEVMEKGFPVLILG